MACNNSGVWNEMGDTLDFSVAPAYYQTNWFRALCVVAFLAVLWTAHRLRVGVLEERQAILERHQGVLEQHQGEIGALNERLMKAQEEERIRIAGELHDGVLQRLTSLALQLGTATLALPPDSEPKAEVREVEKDLIQVGAEIRQLSHELHPAVLHEKGLPEALASYCEEFSATRGIPISYEGEESVEELSPGAALCIYRIAQEALGNVAKHAQAKQVQVRLTRTDSCVCLVVSDDGVGFNPDGRGKSGGLGLINMRERVRQLNGTFTFESEPGGGTTVKAEVPFRPAS
jgi:signal transduction histidine kinase